MEPVLQVARYGRRCSADAGGHVRRLDLRPGDGIQERVGSGNRADLCAAGRLVLGGLSAMLDLRYPGIGIQAVSLTFGTLFVLLLAYRSGLIKVTQKFRLGVIAATGGIFFFYLAQMLLGFFGIQFYSHQRRGPHRHRLQPAGGGHCGAEPGARLRLYRAGRAGWARRSTWSGTAPSASW